LRQTNAEYEFYQLYVILLIYGDIHILLSVTYNQIMDPILGGLKKRTIGEMGRGVG